MCIRYAGGHESDRLRLRESWPFPGFLPVADRLCGVNVVGDSARKAKFIISTAAPVPLPWKHIMVEFAVRESLRPELQYDPNRELMGITRPAPFFVLDFPTRTSPLAKSIWFQLSNLSRHPWQRSWSES